MNELLCENPPKQWFTSNLVVFGNMN